MKTFQRGVSMIETVIAIPLLLFLGLAALQWMLVFQARYALTTAVQDAARSGSIGFAQEQPILAGFARGLVPYLYGASDLTSFQTNLLLSSAHIQFAQAQGFSRLRIISPTSESFSDWGRPARDAKGDLIVGLEEIPNDNLSGLTGMQTPKSGVSGTRLGYSVGTSSKQSLSDANLLKLELTYGVPLKVPFVGRITVVVLKTLNGCASATPTADCSFYDSFDENGQPTARLPVLITAQIRMQTPARRSGFTASAAASVFVGDSLGAGQTGSSSEFKATPLPASKPVQFSGNEGVKGGAGYLQLGADRGITVPNDCYVN
jgi:hypothetical protein